LAVAVLGADVPEVIVEVAIVPTGHQPVHVSLELLEPSPDKVVGVELLRFNLSDRGKRDNNPTDNNSVARYSDMLEGPTITQKLGT
jgi:hypothetical protein